MVLDDRMGHPASPGPGAKLKEIRACFPLPGDWAKESGKEQERHRRFGCKVALVVDLGVWVQ